MVRTRGVREWIARPSYNCEFGERNLVNVAFKAVYNMYLWFWMSRICPFMMQ